MDTVMNYKTVAQLNQDILEWFPKLPRDIDLLVGIPRSGLLVANLLALYLNLPFTDIDGLIANRVFSGGSRLQTLTNYKYLFERKNLKILVVDDSLWSGTQINIVKERINLSKLNHIIQYGVVYLLPGAKEKVDYYFEEIPFPRIFQWNIMNSNVIEKSCVDIDGVLCLNPTDGENDDGEKYIHFLENAIPYWIPTVKIKALVTCRLEKYRKTTEQWLNKNHINYEKLYMLNLPNKKSRMDYGHARFKAEIFNLVGAKYFIESSYNQACDIAKITHKPVFCVETMDFINCENS